MNERLKHYFYICNCTDLKEFTYLIVLPISFQMHNRVLHSTGKRKADTPAVREDRKVKVCDGLQVSNVHYDHIMRKTRIYYERVKSEE